MSDPRDMGTEWYVGRHDGSADGARSGPYSWDLMTEYAREGRIAPTDLVWHPSLPAWVPATSVPGLLPAQPAAPAPEPRRKTGRTVAWVAVALVLVGVIVAGTFFLLGGDGDGVAGLVGDDTPDLGTAEVVLPEPSSLVESEEWGEVPADQVGVTLLDGYERDAAEAVASALGGSIVGEIEYVSMYQISFPGETEADLVAALDTASAAEGVEFAFPNQQTFLDTEIWGVRYSPYDDPVYEQDDAGKGYEAIGVGRAWTYVKGAGVGLGSVKVGIIDDGLYREGEGRMSEFGGDVKVSFPDPEAGELDAKEVWDDGKVNPAGSHGTGVATIIGADPDNGGPSGIAGPLGDKLEISMINKFGGKYGLVETEADPDDPTKLVYSDGKSYVQGSFVAINRQIEAGATIINCSWGNANAHPAIASAYEKYFEKLAEDHPDVLFVCSGGNTGTALDGSRRYPSGLALPNMITVGAVNNDGTLADYSSKSSENYEVTLGAPGTDAVVGQTDDGSAARQDGTSFSAPHVAAAAAMLRSIDPDLSAGDIKRILVETARPGITVGDTSNLAPPEVGGRILAVDQAVLKVINDKRTEEDLAPFDPEELEKLGVVDAVAITGEPGEYTVRGIVEAAGEDGVGLGISVSGENHAIGGSTSQALSGPGEVEWGLTLSEDEGVVTVTRDDNGARSVITIESFDIDGHWEGTFTITDVQVDDAEAAEDDGCSVMIAEQLIGSSFPATMDVTTDGGSAGTAVFTVDGGDEPSVQTLSLVYAGGTITFEGMEDTDSMTATVARAGEALSMQGSLSGGGDGWRYTGTFSLTKPE